MIESGGSYLLLDMGVPLSRIREALNHDLSKVVGCLVTHEHADHAGFLPQLERETDIPIYCTEGTRKAFYLSNRCQCIKHKKYFKCGDVFEVFCTELSHDKDPFIECFGFVVWCRGKKLFYATDTGSVINPGSAKFYQFVNLTYLMIEANHSFQALIDSDLHPAAVKRICETHLSIDQVCEFVERHPDLEEIHLIHLSDGHSDAKEFKRMVQDVSGVPVFIAGK